MAGEVAERDVVGGDGSDGVGRAGEAGSCLAGTAAAVNASLSDGVGSGATATGWTDSSLLIEPFVTFLDLRKVGAVAILRSGKG